LARFGGLFLLHLHRDLEIYNNRILDGMNAKLCCIGHITLDKIITPRQTVHMPGGTAYYFAHAMGQLDPADFALVTSLAESEMQAVEDIRSEKIAVKVLPSRHTVYFENAYGENSDERKQRVLDKADPFTVEGLTDVNAEIFHLGSLLADDFPMELLKYLSSKAMLSVDAQGYLREVRGEKVYPVDWKDKEEALRYIDILKVNEHEMESLTGETDPYKAAVILADMGVKEVVITLGSNGSLIYAEQTFFEIPVYRTDDVVDATGCGDTYMAGYLYQRSRGASYAEAGRFAAAMCTIKLGASGPFSGSKADVLNLIANA
jgi:sugar/nucleoside kinase (ribokinase family)